ncbi:hypothetical protein BMS3Abin10_01624 [bacterium BMS3Abin10]|nr:hypothetical protein BMS3Abin10_01624 [bacterium BMS3Abin10]
MGLFNFIKKKISLEDYAELLLEALIDLEKRILQDFLHRTFECDVEDEALKYEVRIFSLWLITLRIPSEKLRDILHDTFCTSIGANQEVKEMFYQDIDRRYRNYFTAYNMWIKNPQNGHMIGTAIIETMKNLNPNFSLEKGPLPLIGAMEAHKGFLFFTSTFELSLKMIGFIKDKYTVEGL